MVTGPVREPRQEGIDDAPVLDRPARLRRFHDSGTGYKYPDLLTYFSYALRDSYISVVLFGVISMV